MAAIFPGALGGRIPFEVSARGLAGLAWNSVGIVCVAAEVRPISLRLLPIFESPDKLIDGSRFQYVDSVNQILSFHSILPVEFTVALLREIGRASCRERV